MHGLYRSRRMARNRLSPLPYSRISSNSSFPAPHRGQTQSSGRRRNRVPRSTPLSGSPTSGSYTYAHTMHRYLAIAAPLSDYREREGLYPPRRRNRNIAAATLSGWSGPPAPPPDPPTPP